MLVFFCDWFIRKKHALMNHVIFASLILIASLYSVPAAEWQWSVPVNSIASSEAKDNPRAFLWIPPACKKIRAVIVGQNNMIEEGILQHAKFRKEMSRLGIAEIFIAPPFDTFQNATNNDA